MLKSLNLKSEHSALDTVNRLEAVTFSWKERIMQEDGGKSPLRTSWPFMRDSTPSTDKVELLLDRAETLLKLLKTRYPNLPQTFLDATKVQYGKVSFILIYFLVILSVRSFLHMLFFFFLSASFTTMLVFFLPTKNGESMLY